MTSTESRHNRWAETPIVAWDLCGTGIGDLVALAEGPESAQPFYPEVKPLDASIVALLDEVSLQ